MTRRILSILLISSLTLATSSIAADDQPRASDASRPLCLHPENSRYLLFRGRPTILVGSTEHYGAVLNGDFDAIPYLNELKRSGLNLTRTFSGTYREVPGSFRIQHNTLAPSAERYVAPWPRGDVAGAADGRNRFDLSRWNGTYFERLRAFVSAASERGIVVEFTLFCPFYDDSLWAVNPMNARNNVNNIGGIARTDVYTGKNRELQAIQEAFARKVVRELNGFDNVYFEICNEPYFGGVTLEWQARIASVIVDAEKDLPRKHLIAQNIANEKARVDRPDPSVSIFNFHYATPPATIALNEHLRRPIGDDETGFRGVEDRPYRIEAWDFLIAGGAIFDHLDYSFTTDHEDGTARVVAPTPGGGGPGLRAQFHILKRFVEGFEFVKMAPDRTAIARIVPETASARALSEPGRSYAIYVQGGHRVTLSLQIPAGRYRAEWTSPLTGKVERAQEIEARGTRVDIKSPDYADDIALTVRRVEAR